MIDVSYFQEASENFSLHFQSISHQLCELLSTKSSEDHKYINECLDEWYRIAQVAPEGDKLAVFDSNFSEL